MNESFQERFAKRTVGFSRRGNRDSPRAVPFRLLSSAPPALCLSLLLMAGSAGCGDSSGSKAPNASIASGSVDQWQDELFTYAINNLNRLEQFDTGEMLPQILRRIGQQGRPRPPSARVGDALLATWPEPEMLREIVNRLNQWVGSQEPPPGWKRDPLVDELPAALRELPLIQGLDKLEFTGYDGFALREIVWLRDVSIWARGKELNDADRARRLFDWTVRNIQLQAATTDWVPQLPWETLLFGRGTALERAWVFILLARQQRLDAVLLALGKSLPATGDHRPAQTRLLPWTVGVLSEDELYLFDPALGLPIPAPDGLKLDNAGQLDIEPATLAQVLAEDGLLRQLDVEGTSAYPVGSSDLKHVVALVEASPTYLAGRMKLVQSRLDPQQKMILTVSPSRQVERFKKALKKANPDVLDPDVRLWTFPFEAIRRRSQLSPQRIQERLLTLLPFYIIPTAPLYKGRMLHLKGELTGQQGATATQHYWKAWPPDPQLAEAERQLAAQYYRMIRKANPSIPENQVRLLAQEEARVKRVILLRGRQDANYWAGLVAFETAEYPSAIYYFATRTLQASPGGPWTPGARYNLARAYEASGQYEKAVQQYEADPDSPGHVGNLLRARWLKALSGASEGEQPARGPETRGGESPTPNAPIQPGG